MTSLVEYLETRGLEDDELGLAIDVIAAADQRWLTRVRGYPKDNEMLPPIDERFEDPTWLACLEIEADQTLFDRLYPASDR